SLNSRFKSLDTLKVKIISVTFRRVIRTNHKKASKIWRSEERFSRNAETDLVCRLLLEKKNRATHVRSPIHRRARPAVCRRALDRALLLRVARPPDSTLFPYTTLFRSSLNSRFKSLDTLKVKIISVTFRRVIRTNHKKASKIWRHENIQLGGCQS